MSINFRVSFYLLIASKVDRTSRFLYLVIFFFFDGKSPRDTRVVIFIVTLKPSLRSIKHRVSNAFPPFRPLFPSFLRTRSLDYRFRSLCTSRLQENGFLSRNILRPNVTSIRKLFIFLYNFLYRDEFNPNIISYFIYIYLFIFQTTFKRLYITRI